MTNGASIDRPAASSKDAEHPIGWGWILAYGVIMILIGVLALLDPVATGAATGLLIGVILVVYGIFAIMAGLSSLSRRARWIELLLGVLGVLAGAMTIVNPFAGALSLVMLIGAWLLVSGICEIVSRVRIAHDRAWRLLLGVLDVVLGGLLLFGGPVTGLVFLAYAVGISLLFRGAFLITLAMALRRMALA